MAVTRIRFPFLPKLIMLLGSKNENGEYSAALGSYSYGGYLVYANMLTTAYQKGFGLSNYYSSNNYGKKSSDGKTFTWYYDYTGSRPNDGINYQCNVSGTVYYYAILG